MINLKVFYVICFATPCIMGLSILEPKGFYNVAGSESTTIKGQGHSDVRTKEGPCDAPGGMGLKNLIEQIDRLIPKKEIRRIAQTYAEDPQIIALQAFAKSPRVQQKIKAIRNSQEYQIIKDYACRVLHLDLNNYHHLTRALIRVSLRHSDAIERKGIRGLLNAIAAVLPEQKLRELYENLMRTDDELVKAVAHLKSEEFRQLLLNLKNNVPEYQELRRQLIELGVPVEAMRNILAKALEWSDDFDVLL